MCACLGLGQGAFQSLLGAGRGGELARAGLREARRDDEQCQLLGTASSESACQGPRLLSPLTRFLGPQAARLGLPIQDPGSSRPAWFLGHRCPSGCPAIITACPRPAGLTGVHGALKGLATEAPPAQGTAHRPLVGIVLSRRGWL